MTGPGTKLLGLAVAWLAQSVLIEYGSPVDGDMVALKFWLWLFFSMFRSS